MDESPEEIHANLNYWLEEGRIGNKLYQLLLDKRDAVPDIEQREVRCLL